VSPPEEPQGPGRRERVRLGLRRTRDGLLDRFASLFRGTAPGPDWGDDLEAALVEADIGPQAAARIVTAVRGAGGAPTWDGVRQAALEILRDILLVARPPRELAAAPRPRVVLCVGVNGGGKTTTAGKLARRMTAAGRTVILCAADTFRAGAGEQLRAWAERAGAEFVGHRPGADPSSVVYDAASAALARRADALIVDTAGRLHTQDPLMRELEKIVRVIGRRIDGAPHDVLLVLDATIGQNGISQAREFLAAAGVNGLVLTKLDGTARGGIAVRIVQEMGIPLRYVGIGEGPEDLVEFEADEFLEGLLPAAAVAASRTGS
jgi:fused signal recognition particle receptor